jgi:hypothetical protein
MMDISENVLHDLTKRTVDVGDVFLVELDSNDGIRPKDGAATRHKYFVVLGFDNEGNAYGGVIINSHINQRMDQVVKDYHMPIKSTKYSFLRYDSFVDCLTLKTAPVAKLETGKYSGRIDDDDIKLIMGALKESPREKIARLKRFGII